MLLEWKRFFKQCAPSCWQESKMWILEVAMKKGHKDDVLVLPPSSHWAAYDAVRRLLYLLPPSTFVEEAFTEKPWLFFQNFILDPTVSCMVIYWMKKQCFKLDRNPLNSAIVIYLLQQRSTLIQNSPWKIVYYVRSLILHLELPI